MVGPRARAERGSFASRRLGRRSSALLVVAAVAAVALGCAGAEPAATGVAPTTGARDRSASPGSRPVGANPGTATGAGTEPPSVTPPPVPTFEPEPAIWSSCGSGSRECATVEVPLDHADPTGRRIPLDVARVRAADGAPSLGPLFVNPGGPGGRAIPFLDAVAGRHPRFDVYAFEPRGLSKGARFECDTAAVERFRAVDSSPDHVAEQAKLDEAAAAVARSCSSPVVGLAAHMTTDDAADDLEVVRRAIGAERISWLGYSYGTLLGLRYAERHPNGLRAMVLDGVVDPAIDLGGLLEAQAVAFDAARRRAGARCWPADTDRCPVDPDAAYLRLRDAVEVAPLRGGDATVGPAELALGTISASYTATGLDDLVGAVARWAHERAEADAAGDRDAAGDADAALAPLVAAAAARYTSSGAFGTYVGVECTDTTRPRSTVEARALAARLEQLAPGVGAATANEMLPCVSWPVPAGPPRPATAAVLGGADVPMLVIAVDGDAATPLSFARAVAEAVPRADLLVVAGEGHTAFGLGSCVTPIVTAFLVDLQHPPAAATC